MRVVLTTWGSFGDLHPFMALAGELQRRGHKAIIATIPIYREKVERAGIGFHPVRPDFPPSAQFAELIRRAIDAREGPQTIFREMIAPHMKETYEDTLDAVKVDGGADLFVSHMATLAAPLVAQKTGIRWASTVLAPISFLSVYDPPSMPQFPALRGLTALHPAIASLLWRFGKWSTRSWVRSVDDLRKEIGLPPGEHPIFEGQHSPQLVLALFSPLFAKKQPDFPPQTRITGFVFYDDSQGQPDAPELSHFLDSGEPPILFTLGSSAVWVGEEFYRTSIEAARRLNRRAIVLAGDKSFGELPSSIAAFAYAPYNTVMPRAACIVHQGGVGTTAQGLRSARPMLIMPFGHDTADNARRAAGLGVARVIRQKRYTVENVVKELSELLESAAYSRRATEVGARIQAENGVLYACDALEEFTR